MAVNCSNCGNKDKRPFQCNDCAAVYCRNCCHKKLAKTGIPGFGAYKCVKCGGKVN